MNKIHFWQLIFLIVVLMFIVTGCSLLPNTSLEILQYNLEKTSGTAQIVGVAHNNGSAKLEYAEIEGNFYDKDETLVYSGVASTNNLDLGQIWEFTISYPTPTGKEVHPSLKILSCSVEIDSSGAKAVGEAQNDGDVLLSYIQITATFYDAAGVELALGTSSMVDLEVGETSEYTIFHPGSDYEKVDYATVEVTNTDYEPEPTQNVDHATVEVGTLRGSTVMP